MDTEPYATRRELDQVREEMRMLRADSTTVAVLSQQLVALTAAFVEFKTSVTDRFDAHDKLHGESEKARTDNRRWLVGTAIAAICGLIGLYGWIAVFLPHH